jgi:hypothetical protein
MTALLHLPSPSLIELESALRDRLWRGNMLVASNPSMPSGFAELDKELPGGGWPTHCLSELLLSHYGLGEVRLLAPVLARLSRAHRQIILLLPANENEQTVYPDGWAQIGIDPARLLMVRAPRPADRLWALEQALKSASFGALIGWVDPLRPEALRRLQVAAAGANGLSSKGTSERKLSVRIVKRRGPVLAAPLLLDLPAPRPLRAPLVKRPTDVASPRINRHAVGRTVLPYFAARSHPAPAT